VNTKKKLRELDVKISEFDIADADKYFFVGKYVFIIEKVIYFD
jgi:hypothetical protein